MENTKQQTPSYEMFSKAWDKAVHSLTMKVIKKVNGRMKVTKEELDEMIEKGLKKIAEKHSEVHDTEPPSHVAWRVNEALKGNGYGFELSRFDW